MAIDVKTVAKLRAMTGAGMMDAKAALEAASGDLDKAVDHLRQAGRARADKKAGRTAAAGLIDAYVHMGRVGAIVEVNCETDFVARTDEFKQFTRDIAMQVAASHPEYVSRANVPQPVIDNEKKVYKTQEKGKPADVLDKIIAGKLDKFYSQVCLLEQPFIKDEDKTIEDYLKEIVGKLGENVVIADFARLELGGSDGE